MDGCDGVVSGRGRLKLRSLLLAPWNRRDAFTVETQPLTV